MARVVSAAADEPVSQRALDSIDLTAQSHSSQHGGGGRRRLHDPVIQSLVRGGGSTRYAASLELGALSLWASIDQPSLALHNNGDTSLSSFPQERICCFADSTAVGKAIARVCLP